jgi:hypothetical protein
MLIKSHNYSISLTGTCEYMQLIYACATVCDCICTIIFMSWAWIWLAARPSIPLCSTYFESCHLVPCVSWSNNLSRPTFWSQRNGRRGSWTNMRTVKYCQKDSGQQNLSFGMIAARCSTRFEFRSRIQRDHHCHTFALRFGSRFSCTNVQLDVQLLQQTQSRNQL